MKYLPNYKKPVLPDPVTQECAHIACQTIHSTTASIHFNTKCSDLEFLLSLRQLSEMCV